MPYQVHLTGRPVPPRSSSVRDLRRQRDATKASRFASTTARCTSRQTEDGTPWCRTSTPKASATCSWPRQLSRQRAVGSSAAPISSALSKSRARRSIRRPVGRPMGLICVRGAPVEKMCRPAKAGADFRYHRVRGMNRRVLLVDADTEFRDTLTKQLGRYRVVVMTEPDAERALTLGQADAPDLVDHRGRGTREGRLQGVPEVPQGLHDEDADHARDRERCGRQLREAPRPQGSRERVPRQARAGPRRAPRQDRQPHRPGRPARSRRRHPDGDRRGRHPDGDRRGRRRARRAARRGSGVELRARHADRRSRRRHQDRSDARRRDGWGVRVPAR